MPGRMRSRNSTTVTSAPSRRHTEPSSSPITPAPITSIFSGTLSSASAPVDETMRFSSISMPLSFATSEPVAITMFLVSSVCVLPSLPFTSTLPADDDAAGAEEGFDLVLLEQEIDALDVAVDGLILERQHRLQIELGLADADAHFREAVPGFLEQLRRHAAALSRECSRHSDRCRHGWRAFRPRRLSCRAAPRGSRRHSRRGRCR